MAEQYHIARNFPTKPFARFACTLEPAPETEAGYKVVDFDPAVADAEWMHRLADHMRKPQLVRSSVVDDERIAEQLSYASPPSLVHFKDAVRSIPGACLSAAGRV